MSSTTVLAVIPNRRPIALAEFRNAHGWAPSIWTRLLTHHGHDGGWWKNDGPLNRLWQEIESLPGWQQAPLLLTFDTGVIPWQSFDWAAAMLDEFERRLPERPDHANHVPAVAAILRTKPEAPLIGVHGTSVSENPFDPWDYDADGPGSGISLDDMYPLRRHRHWLPEYRKDWPPDSAHEETQ